MSSAENVYLYEIEGLVYLFNETGLNNKEKYNYEKLKLWTFEAEKFTVNFLCFHKDWSDVILQFGKEETLEGLLKERCAASEHFQVVAREKNSGFLSHPILQLEDDISLQLGGGRFGTVLHDQRIIENKKVIEVSAFKSAYDQDPFRSFRTPPNMIKEANLNNPHAVEELKQLYAKQRKSEVGWGILGCFGGSLLWLIGTLIVVAIVFYIVSRVMA